MSPSFRVLSLLDLFLAALSRPRQARPLDASSCKEPPLSGRQPISSFRVPQGHSLNSRQAIGMQAWSSLDRAGSPESELVIAPSSLAALALMLDSSQESGDGVRCNVIVHSRRSVFPKVKCRSSVTEGDFDTEGWVRQGRGLPAIRVNPPGPRLVLAELALLLLSCLLPPIISSHPTATHPISSHQ